VVAHLCNPSYSGDRDRVDLGPRQEVCETPCQRTAGHGGSYLSFQLCGSRFGQA
jgi:hypothetical protein